MQIKWFMLTASVMTMLMVCQAKVQKEEQGEKNVNANNLAQAVVAYVALLAHHDMKEKLNGPTESANVNDDSAESQRSYRRGLMGGGMGGMGGMGSKGGMGGMMGGKGSKGSGGKGKGKMGGGEMGGMAKSLTYLVATPSYYIFSPTYGKGAPILPPVASPIYYSTKEEYVYPTKEEYGDAPFPSPAAFPPSVQGW